MHVYLYSKLVYTYICAVNKVHESIILEPTIPQFFSESVIGII